MSKRMTAIIDALRSLPEDAFGYVADTPDQPGWWIRDELIDTACKELDRIRDLEAQLERVRELPGRWRSWLFDSSTNGLKGPDDCADELEAALQSAAGSGSNQPEVDEEQNDG